MSNLQLQKMLYFIQVAYCKATQGELLFNEEFEAWPYGPVISDVYREYSMYGGNVIEKRYSDGTQELQLPPSATRFINEAIESLRKRYPWDLVQLSHAEGSPWSQVYAGGKGHKKVIANDLVRRSALA